MSQSARTLATLVALLAVGLGVGLYAWKGVYEGDEKESERKDVEERLFAPAKAGERGADGSVARVEFVKLTITYGGETSRLERGNGNEPWKMVAPAAASIDAITVDGVTSQLQVAKFKYVADESPDDAALEKYGLLKPSFLIEAEALVGDSAERRTVKLVGGAENTFNGSIFMRRNDEKKVWGAEGGVKWSFQKSPFDLRSKEVLALDEQKLTRVEVKSANNQYQLTRDSDRRWTVEAAHPAKGEEKRFLADQASISGAIGGLKAERAIAFPTAEPSGPAFEELTFFEQDQKTTTVKVWKLPGDAGAESVVVLRDGSAGRLLAAVSSSAPGFFDRHPWDLRDRSLVVFVREAVAKVIFHLADGTEVTAEKDSADGGAAETWRVTSPKAGPAKQFKMAALLWTVGSLKTTEIVDENPKDVLKYGFDRWVSVAGADGKELGRLWVGSDVKDKAGFKYVRGTKGQVVVADASRLADLPQKVEDVLDAPPPLPAFDGGR